MKKIRITKESAYGLFILFQLWNVVAVVRATLGRDTSFWTIIAVGLTCFLAILVTKKFDLSVWVVAALLVFVLFFMTQQIQFGMEIVSEAFEVFECGGTVKPLSLQRGCCQIFVGMLGWIGEIHVGAISIKQAILRKKKKKQTVANETE